MEQRKIYNFYFLLHLGSFFETTCEMTPYPSSSGLHFLTYHGSEPATLWLQIWFFKISFWMCGLCWKVESFQHQGINNTIMLQWASALQQGHSAPHSKNRYNTVSVHFSLVGNSNYFVVFFSVRQRIHFCEIQVFFFGSLVIKPSTTTTTNLKWKKRSVQKSSTASHDVRCVLSWP